MSLDPTLLLAIVGGLCLLWCGAGAQKLQHWRYHRDALSRYELLPASWVVPVSLVLPAIEILVGIGLLVPEIREVAAAGSLALLTVYTSAIGINLARGRRDIDCGCGGPALRQYLSGGLAVRNLCLMGFSVLALAPAGERPLLWVDAVTVSAAVAAGCLLHMAANQALAQAPLLASLRR
jgi:uncharacterized membrane protein